MNAVTNNAHMQTVPNKAQAGQLKNIFSRHRRKEAAERDAHQDQCACRHDQVTAQQKTTGRQRVQQILLHAEVGTPNQNQNHGGHQGQGVLLFEVQSVSNTATGTRAAKAHINS